MCRRRRRVEATAQGGREKRGVVVEDEGEIGGRSGRGGRGGGCWWREEIGAERVRGKGMEWSVYV